MTLEAAQRFKINPDAPTNEIGLYHRGPSYIVLDSNLDNLDNLLPWTFKWIHIGVGGTLIVEDTKIDITTGEKAIKLYLGLSSDSWIPTIGQRVLSTKVIQGFTYNNSANDIIVYGGA